MKKYSNDMEEKSFELSIKKSKRSDNKPISLEK